MAGDDGLTGDFKKFRLATARLAKAPAHLLDAAEEVAGNTLLNLTLEGFVKEQDPYGDPWEERQVETKETQGKKVLSRKGLLKGSFNRQTSRGQVTVSTPLEYADYHQRPKRGRNGKLKRPRRRMIPTLKKGFPRKYGSEIRKSMGDVFESYFRGRK